MNTVDYLQALLALIFVLGLLALLPHALRRLGLSSNIVQAPDSPDLLQILASKPLDVKHRFVLLGVGQRRYAVLLTTGVPLLLEQWQEEPQKMVQTTDRAGDAGI